MEAFESQINPKLIFLLMNPGSQERGSQAGVQSTLPRPSTVEAPNTCSEAPRPAVLSYPWFWTSLKCSGVYGQAKEACSVKFRGSVIYTAPSAEESHQLWMKTTQLTDALHAAKGWSPLPYSVYSTVLCSVVSDSATLWTVAHQAPLSMGFSRQEYWSGLPCLSPGDLPSLPRDEPSSLALVGEFFWAFVCFLCRCSHNALYVKKPQLRIAHWQWAWAGQHSHGPSSSAPRFWGASWGCRPEEALKSNCVLLIVQSIHESYRELVRIQLLIQWTLAELEILHFQPASRGCQSCWSVNHTLNSKSSTEETK